MRRTLRPTKYCEGRLENLERYKLMEPMALQLARNYRRRLPPRVLLCDVEAAARIGLWDAITKKPDAPGFGIYARRRIIGSITDELRRQDWLTRYMRTHAADGELTEIVYDCFDLMTTPPEQEAMLEQSERLAWFRKRVALLSPRLQRVIAETLEGRKLQDIGSGFGHSEAWACQNLKQAIAEIGEYDA